MPPAPPSPTRYSALMYLLGRADSTDSSFFTPTTQPQAGQVLQWKLEGLTLAVRKRSFSEADPSNITYEIYLGPLLQGSKRLLVCVLRPNEKDTEANRVAYKRCLKDLADKPAFEMSQHNA